MCSSDLEGLLGVPQVYVRVTAQKTFTTLFPYPGIPKTTNLNRQATVRLQ